MFVVVVFKGKEAVFKDIKCHRGVGPKMQFGEDRAQGPR